MLIAPSSSKSRRPHPPSKSPHPPQQPSPISISSSSSSSSSSSASSHHQRHHQHHHNQQPQPRTSHPKKKKHNSNNNNNSSNNKKCSQPTTFQQSSSNGNTMTESASAQFWKSIVHKKEEERERGNEGGGDTELLENTDKPEQTTAELGDNESAVKESNRRPTSITATTTTITTTTTTTTKMTTEITVWSDMVANSPFCVICHGTLDNSNRAIIKGCNHCFCYRCIKEWMEHKALCPLCKQRITVLLCADTSSEATTDDADDADDDGVHSETPPVSFREEHTPQYLLDQTPICDPNAAVEGPLDCLDHTYFLGEVTRLISLARHLENTLHRAHAGFTSHFHFVDSSKVPNEVRWQATQSILHRLERLRTEFQQFESFDPFVVLQDLYSMQDRLAEIQSGRYPEQSSSRHDTNSAVLSDEDNAFLKEGHPSESTIADFIEFGDFSHCDDEDDIDDENFHYNYRGQSLSNKHHSTSTANNHHSNGQRRRAPGGYKS